MEENTRQEKGLRTFLNSGFGLWLLSAVFISGSGAWYQHWEKNRDEQRASFQQQIRESSEKIQAVEKLDVEISYRLSQVLLHLWVLNGQPAIATEKQAVKILRGLTLKPAESDVLYPDFASYTLPALLAELRRRLTDFEKQEVERSIAKLTAMSNGDRANGSARKIVPEQIAAALMSEVVLKRWKGTRFHFVDCSPNVPFC